MAFRFSGWAHMHRGQLALAMVFAMFPAARSMAAVDLGDNVRMSLDVSSRVVKRESLRGSQHALGLDLHKVFSGVRGDIGTLTFQPFVVRPLSGGSGGNTWDPQWRIANFNYTARGQGRYNLRIGHFETPFGLEHVIQTNGTLRQVRSPTILKADWGVSINGTSQLVEYEVAYMTGTGNKLKRDGGGLFAGRIGLAQRGPWWVGLSLLDGLIDAGIAPTELHRKSLDLGIALPLGFELVSELVHGQDNGTDIEHRHIEFVWQHPGGALEIFAQQQRGWRRPAGLRTHSRTFSLGLRYEPNNHWSASIMGASAETDDQQRVKMLTAQIRFRT